MRAVIMSDSHGDIYRLRMTIEGVWQQVGRVDAYIHLGDGALDFQDLESTLLGRDPQAALYQVRGNCDWSVSDVPARQLIWLDDLKVLICHGHHYNVKSGLYELDEAADANGCALALYGHTHEPAMDFRRAMLVNPGSAHDGNIALLETVPGQLPKVRLLHF